MVYQLLAIGVAVGVVSGLIGVGGGILIVPALVYLLGFSQHEAQGTSIAVLVPPIGIFAAIQYYRYGFVRLPVVVWLALGFAVGAFGGALLAGQLSAALLRRAFGVIMLFIALQMLFTANEPRLYAVLPTAIGTGLAAFLGWASRHLGVGRRLRDRVARWTRRRRPPRPLGGDIEYHI